MSTTEAGVTPIRIDPVELSLAIARATRDHMNALAPDLPPIGWHLRGSHADDRHLSGHADWGPDSDAIARQWAERLGLAEQPPTSWGTRQFTGPMEGFDRISIWYIDDRAAFYRK